MTRESRLHRGVSIGDGMTSGGPGDMLSVAHPFARGMFMRRAHSSLVALAIAAAPALLGAQAQQGDANRAVTGGGIAVAGWQGKADGGAAITDAKLTKEGDAFHVVTGPATGYWNPANVATGNYTVKATFKEPQFQGLNDHPHPYGVMIGGNDLGTDNQSYLYCAAYGNG